MDSWYYFQSVISEHFAGEIERMIQCFNESVMYAETEERLLEHIKAFLTVFRKVCFKFIPAKLRFFHKEVTFREKPIWRERIRFDLRNLEALWTMQKPEMDSELQQLMCATK